MDVIDSLGVSITDQDDNLLNLRDEKLTIRFHIRETYKIIIKKKKKKMRIYKMTSYTNVKVNISGGQKEKLQRAITVGCSALSIRLGHEDLKGNDILAVTNS